MQSARWPGLKQQLGPDGLEHHLAPHELMFGEPNDPHTSLSQATHHAIARMIDQRRREVWQVGNVAEVDLGPGARTGQPAVP